MIKWIKKFFRKSPKSILYFDLVWEVKPKRKKEKKKKPKKRKKKTSYDKLWKALV